MELDVLSLTRSSLFCAALAVSCAGATPAPSEHEPAPTSSPPIALASSATPEPAVLPDAGIETASADAGETTPSPDAGSAAPAEALPLPEGTVVLHIGDSMAGALGVALNDELKQRKVKGWLRFKKASYIPTWAWSQDLPLYLLQMKPDLVLITLGTNEMKMLDPSQRAPTIKKLVGELGGRPCVWIAPPKWTSETGLYDVIKQNIAPCRYMDTDQLYPDMPRLGDKIHPTIPARKEWAKRVVDWLARERQPTKDQPWALRPE